jgi:hypothetical protein
MIIDKAVRAAMVAAIVGLGAAAAQADECEAMTKAVKALVDKLDPAAKGGNNPARTCAAFGEGLGLIKSFRIVNDECLDEGDERTRLLAGLDRSIRTLQSSIDKMCE